MTVALVAAFESKLSLYKVKLENKHEKVFHDILCAHEAHQHV